MDQNGHRPPPAWLTHIPAIPPEQMPRAPATFTYESQTVDNTLHVPEPDRDSQAWHRQMLQHHPAYEPPNGQQRQPFTHAAQFQHGNFAPPDFRQTSQNQPSYGLAPGQRQQAYKYSPESQHGTPVHPSLGRIPPPPEEPWRRSNDTSSQFAEPQAIPFQNIAPRAGAEEPWRRAIDPSPQAAAPQAGTYQSIAPRAGPEESWRHPSYDESSRPAITPTSASQNVAPRAVFTESWRHLPDVSSRSAVPQGIPYQNIAPGAGSEAFQRQPYLSPGPAVPQASLHQNVAPRAGSEELWRHHYNASSQSPAPQPIPHQNTEPRVEARSFQFSKYGPLASGRLQVPRPYEQHSDSNPPPDFQNPWNNAGENPSYGRLSATPENGTYAGRPLGNAESRPYTGPPYVNMESTPYSGRPFENVENTPYSGQPLENVAGVPHSGHPLGNVAGDSYSRQPFADVYPRLMGQGQIRLSMQENERNLETETDGSSEEELTLDVEGVPQIAGRKRARPRLKDTEPARKRHKAKGRVPGSQAGPRPPMKPTEQFTETFNAATDAFIDEQDYDKAQVLVLRAIGMNPEIFSAHSLLADIHFAKKQPAEAVDALIMGLHGHGNDAELWRKVADTILQNEHESHTKKVERATYCFSGIIRKDPRDADARFQRAQCYRQLEAWNKAFGDLDIIFRQDPHNSNILSALSDLCRDINDLNKARLIYEEHFNHYRETGLSPENSFSWEDVGVYAELVADIEGLARGVATFKEYARLLTGRDNETYWDRYPNDDREFDQFAYPRRSEVQEFVDNPLSEELYGLALPLDIRGKLGILRLKQNLVEEAKTHFSWLDPEARDEDAPIHDYADTFYDIAKALYSVREYQQALSFMEALSEQGWDLGVDFWMDLGACSYVCGKRDEAKIAYLNVIERDPKTVDARTELCKLFQEEGDRDTALKYGREAVLISQKHLVAPGERRKYEKRDQRLAREDAERTLKKAFRMPLGNSNKRGKVPRELKYRTRKSRKLTLYAADLIEEERIQPTVKRYARKRHDVDDDSSDGSPSRTQRVKAPPKAKRAKPPQPNKDNPIKHAEEMQAIYQTMLGHEQTMRDGDELSTTAWLDCASTLISDFRGVKWFYPYDRSRLFDGYGNGHAEPQHIVEVPDDEADTATADGATDVTRNTPRPKLVSYHRTIPTTYCEIPFDSWLDILLEYALVLATAQPGDTFQRDCYDTIQAALDCILFCHNASDVLLIQVAHLSCAIAMNDEPTVFNTCMRWFMNKFTFCTDTYRLFMAVNFLYPRVPRAGGKAGLMEHAAFNTGPNQKFVFRQVLSIDTHLPDDYNKDGVEGGVPAFMREPRTGVRRFAPDAPPHPSTSTLTSTRTTPAATGTSADPGQVASLRPQEMDVVLLTLYAHILMSSNSFPNALSYLYRAHAIDSENPIVLFSMALCYMHQQFKRQVERRHQYVLMGWAWFGEYERARLKWAESYVEYGVGEQIEAKTDEGGGVEDTGTHAVIGAHEQTLRKKRDREHLLSIVRREIEFNRARCWEMLGMGDLAIRGYSKVLAISVDPPATTKNGNRKSNAIGNGNGNEVDMSTNNDEENKNGEGLEQDSEDEEDEGKEENWTMEAAYAMHLIYATNGDARKAMEIAEKYLVV